MANFKKIDVGLILSEKDTMLINGVAKYSDEFNKRLHETTDVFNLLLLDKLNTEIGYDNWALHFTEKKDDTFDVEVYIGKEDFLKATHLIETQIPKKKFTFIRKGDIHLLY